MICPSFKITSTVGIEHHLPPISCKCTPFRKSDYLPKYSFFIMQALARPTCIKEPPYLVALRFPNLKARSNKKSSLCKFTYDNSHHCARKIEIYELSQNLKDSKNINLCQVDTFNSSKQHNRCCVINNPFTKYKTVKQGCLIWMKNLNVQNIITNCKGNQKKLIRLLNS